MRAGSGTITTSERMVNMKSLRMSLAMRKASSGTVVSSRAICLAVSLPDISHKKQKESRCELRGLLQGPIRGQTGISNIHCPNRRLPSP